MGDAIALVFALVFPSIVTWIYFVAAPMLGPGYGLVIWLAYSIGKVIQFGFPVAYARLSEGQFPRPARPSGKALGTGLGFGLAISALGLVGYHFLLKHSALLSDTPDKVYDKFHSMGLDTVARFLAVAVFYSVVHSLLEEYYWRWFVFGWLRRHLRLWPSLVLASLGFMAHHVIVLAVYFPGTAQFLTIVIPLSIAIAVGGAFWCWLYDRTGSLYAVWISHAIIDAAIMWIGYDMVSQRLLPI